MDEQRARSMHSVGAPAIDLDKLQAKVARHLREQRETPAAIRAELERKHLHALAARRAQSESAVAHRTARALLHDLEDEQYASERRARLLPIITAPAVHHSLPPRHRDPSPLPVIPAPGAMSFTGSASPISGSASPGYRQNSALMSAEPDDGESFLRRSTRSDKRDAFATELLASSVPLDETLSTQCPTELPFSDEGAVPRGLLGRATSDPRPFEPIPVDPRPALRAVHPYLPTGGRDGSTATRLSALSSAPPPEELFAVTHGGARALSGTASPATRSPPTVPPAKPAGSRHRSLRSPSPSPSPSPQRVLPAVRGATPQLAVPLGSTEAPLAVGLSSPSPAAGSGLLSSFLSLPPVSTTRRSSFTDPVVSGRRSNSTPPPAVRVGRSGSITAALPHRGGSPDGAPRPLPMPEAPGTVRVAAGSLLTPMTLFAEDTNAAVAYLNSRQLEATAAAISGKAPGQRSRALLRGHSGQLSMRSALHTPQGDSFRSERRNSGKHLVSHGSGGRLLALPQEGHATLMARALTRDVAQVTAGNGGVADGDGGPLPRFTDDHVWSFEVDRLTVEARGERKQRELDITLQAESTVKAMAAASIAMKMQLDSSALAAAALGTSSDTAASPQIGSPAHLISVYKAEMEELSDTSSKSPSKEGGRVKPITRREKRMADYAVEEADAARAIKTADGAAVKSERHSRSAAGPTKWCSVDDDFPFDPVLSPNERPIEWDTNIPQQDLHLYQLYCYYTRTVIIIRPVSDAVPDLYAGNYFLSPQYCDSTGEPLTSDFFTRETINEATTRECRVKGKSISVSLKSSSYAPICGLIPVNPDLSKAYIEAQRRERETEDMMLNAKGNVVTTALLKRLKVLKAQAGNSTQAFKREIEKSLQQSDAGCSALLEQYKEELVVTVDKGAVSQSYIDKFNDAQYLGTTNAKWRGLFIFYAMRENVVVRDENDCPQFYIQRDEGRFHEYLPEVNDTRPQPSDMAADLLYPVRVVTHRIFFTSSTTQRIEEEPESYLIGPDFDGLTYSRRQERKETLEERCAWARRCIDQQSVPSMGLVNEFDQKHIREMRQLTEWKQNHGYECNNTVKTQPLTPGAYTLITPNCVSILNNFFEIIAYIRTAWRRGYPLPLNPNWKVALGPDHLPWLYGEDDMTLPVADDGGWSGLMQRLDRTPNAPTAEELKAQYVSMQVRVPEFVAARDAMEAAQQAAKAAAHATVSRFAQPDQDHPLLTHTHLVLDRRHLIQRFFNVRQWQLFPPWFTAEKSPLAPTPVVPDPFAPTPEHVTARSRSTQGVTPRDLHASQASSATHPPRSGTTMTATPSESSDATSDEYDEEDYNATGRSWRPPSSSASSGFDDAEGGDCQHHDHLVPNAAFEAFRQEQVTKYRHAFDEAVFEFTTLHGKNTLCETLSEYVAPPPL